MPALAARLAGVAVACSLLVGFAAWMQSTPTTVGELCQHVARLADRRNDPQLLVCFERRVRDNDGDRPFVEVFAKRDQGELAMQ